MVGSDDVHWLEPGIARLRCGCFGRNELGKQITQPAWGGLLSRIEPAQLVTEPFLGGAVNHGEGAVRPTVAA